jgi:hypothetical protein
MPAIKETVTGVFNAIFDVIETVWEIIDKSLLDALRLLFSWVDENMEGIQDIFENVFGAIKTVVDTAFGAIEKVVDILETAIDKFKTFRKESQKKVEARREATQSGFIDVKGMRANGGPVESGEAYIVGEREAELFVPESNGRIFNQDQMAAMGGGLTLVVKGNTLLGDSDEMADKLGDIIVTRLREVGVF